MITKTLPKAWTAFAGNKKYLLLAVLFECLFLFCLAYLHMSLFIPTAEAAIKSGELMQAQMQELQQGQAFEFESRMVSNEEFMNTYHMLLANLGLFLGGVFLLFVFLRGPLWYFALKSIHKKMPAKPVLVKFPLLAVFWAAIIMLIFIGYGLATGSTTTLLPFFSSWVSTAIISALMISALYFSTVSFALIPAQNTFKRMFTHGYKNWKTIVPGLLVNVLIMFVMFTVPFNFIQVYTNLALALIIFVTFPSLAFVRLHTIVTVWEKKP